MKKHNSIFKTLAELCYNKSVREEIEERVASKYLSRIDYLVGANNELMKELEQYEKVSMKEKV
jgi:predicted solute-binding protein